MADYKHEGFDAYGYKEEIKFVPMQKACGVTYKKPFDNTPELTEIESFVKPEFVEEKNLVIPDCKCLRK